MIYVGVTAILQFYYISLNLTANTLFSLSRDPAVLSVLGARVLLNLRVEGGRTHEQGKGSLERSETKTIEFAVLPLFTLDETLGGPLASSDRTGPAETDHCGLIGRE